MDNEHAATVPTRGPWRGYSIDTTVDVAREQFQARYGVAPVECFISGPVILVGPIPEREAS